MAAVLITLSEEDARRLVGPRDALAAVRAVFIGMAEGSAVNFPVVREKLNGVGGIFGVKSGFHASAGYIGLKAGGYWAGNEARGIRNHQSTTLLFDAATGQSVALVAANHLTALRTAAAAALGTETLAREKVETLAVIGAGAQALPHIEAQTLARSFSRLIVASRDSRRAERVAEEARRFISDTLAADFRTAAEQADVLLTITPAAEPFIKAGWIRPGTHINAMGADTAGKGEIEPQLLARARVYFDDWQQACTIGECQRAVAMGLLTRDSTGGAIGDVLRQAVPGRRFAEEITLFDSSGVALQDIAIAAAALEKAR